MSLVISLTCALLATLLQQWARRYLKITQSRYSPHKRARIRAFFAEGVEKCLLPWAVEILPTLLHISLFLFFAGLVVFLCNVNLTIFKLVLSWVTLCTVLYGCITCMPKFRHDSPYYTPLSLPAWHIVTGTRYLVYRFLRWFHWSVRVRDRAGDHFLSLERSCRRLLVRGMQKTAEETALELPSEIDNRAFMWTFDCLDEDHEFERFFSGLPGFRSSNIIDDPLPKLTGEEKSKLYEGLRGLLHRTFSSDLLPAPVKNRRAMMCAKAIDPKHMPDAFSIFDTILSNCGHSGPVAIGVAKLLRDWRRHMDENLALDVQFSVSKTIATRQPHDDAWYGLASMELGLPDTLLRDYAAQGDSLPLVILMHLARQRVTYSGEQFWRHRRFVAPPSLDIASNFDIKNTSLELQHDFCALWNQIVDEAQNRGRWNLAHYVLRPIRNIYLTLHQDTDSAPTRFPVPIGENEYYVLREPSSYPMCKVPDHRSHIRDDDVLTTLARSLPALVPSIASPDPSSSLTDAPLPVDETFADALPLDNQITAPVSIQTTGQTTSCHIPNTSPRPVTTCAMHESIDPSRTIQPSTSTPSPKPNALASPPAGIAVVLSSLSCTPSGDPNVRSSPSTPVLDPKGLLLFSGRGSI